MSIADHAMAEYLKKVTIMPDHFKQRDKTKVSTFEVNSCFVFFCFVFFSFAGKDDDPWSGTPNYDNILAKTLRKYNIWKNLGDEFITM